jgi:TatD DNase family protein
MTTLPQKGDFIDIHNHGSRPSPGTFTVDAIMAHENRFPVDLPGVAYTAGIHPWFLTAETQTGQLDFIRKVADDRGIIAIGEAGFDRLKGPPMELQRETFRDQLSIAVEVGKPVVIHCVRAWDELFASHRTTVTRPWLVHGYRGKTELASQLLARGIYISFWFDFIMRPESSRLVKALPRNMIFLETDGADVPIADIYKKVAADLEISVEELQGIMLENFKRFFDVS